jgi:hypothetical protein
VQLEIIIRDCALDRYMNLDVNRPHGILKTIADVKKIMVNKFHNLISED